MANKTNYPINYLSAELNEIFLELLQTGLFSTYSYHNSHLIDLKIKNVDLPYILRLHEKVYYMAGKVRLQWMRRI